MPPLFGRRMNRGAAPMQHCLAVNAWLTAVVGALLPLFVQSRLEAVARRHFSQRQRQQQQQQQQQQQSAGGALPGSDQLEVRRMGWIQLYCCSCFVWVLANAWYGWPNH